MNTDYYESRWPNRNLSMNIFVHEVLNFRYHWHPREYELNILLQGEQYFCRGKENIRLSAGDVILVDPNTGHASYGQAEHTRALVLHFHARAFRDFTGKDAILSFPACCSDESTRNTLPYRQIRRCAAQLITTLDLQNRLQASCSQDISGGLQAVPDAPSVYRDYAARTALEQLLSALCLEFSPASVPFIPEADEQTRKTILRVIQYMETHYPRRITLEETAGIVRYNRTYLSTLFKKTTGIAFYEYLTRIRLQHALHDLAVTDRSLTDVALFNGFPDLKSFNRRFRELLHCLPSEYRSRLNPSSVAREYTRRNFVSCSDPEIREILDRFLE